ncbi:hypothetical protein C0992_005784 [Termitomyces sp. T32_za158]|nr:hypothetical protein C0992_005784 [Termitomyces sp. T32_za158]
MCLTTASWHTRDEHALGTTANAETAILESNIKDKFKTVWCGVELFFNKAEKIVAGTPLQIPVNIVDTLIGLKNAVGDVNNELDALMNRINNHLVALYETLIYNDDTDLKNIVEGFSGYV